MPLNNGLARKQRIEQAIERRLSSLRSKDSSIHDPKRTVLLFYTIAIFAKVANSGKNTIEKKDKDSVEISKEIKLFIEILAIPKSEIEKTVKFYIEATKDETNVILYAKQIANFFSGNITLLEKFARDLMNFSNQLGPFNQTKIEYLKLIFQTINLNDNFFKMILKQYMLPQNYTSYSLLQIGQNITFEELKKAYRAAVRDYHPDNFSSTTTEKFIIEIMNEKFSLLTNAYEKIQIKHGFKVPKN